MSLPWIIHCELYSTHNITWLPLLAELNPLLDILGSDMSPEAPLEGGDTDEEANLDLESWRSQSDEEKNPFWKLLEAVPVPGAAESFGKVIISLVGIYMGL